MSITIKCFASLRETLNINEVKIDCAESMTVADVWAQITTQSPPENLLCAKNHEYVGFSQTVVDGDEIAFFPPVTGG